MGRVKRRKGLARRWLTHAFFWFVLALAVLEILFCVLTRVFYYQSVQDALEGRAQLYNRTLEMASVDSGQSWAARSRELIDYFTDKDKMELQVLDENGTVLLSSTGFVPSSENEREDFDRAMTAEDGKYICRGRTGTGERIMAMTVIELNRDDMAAGALRYVVSLAMVDRQILWLDLSILLVMVVILLFVSASGLYFIRTIVSPVAAIGANARRIASGEYDVSLQKRYDDEIGDLCDTVNYMAGEIRAAEQAKNEFISSVSHELRTPLTAIKGWSETLQEDASDPVLTEQGLAVIGLEAERLSGLVEELLDFSRMESGHLRLRQEPVDPAVVLGEAGFLYRDKATKAGLRFVTHIPDSLPILIGDADRIKQVFLNLLDNAVKYCRPNGTIELEASANADGSRIVLRDDGIGIAAEHLSHITEKFYKASVTAPGSGIGLALVEGILQLHGGRLTINSEQNVGTTVTVDLPRASTGR